MSGNLLNTPRIHHHSRQTSTRNEHMPTRSTYTPMDDHRKDHIDPKGSKKRNHSKQLQAHNLPTNDVENINNTNKARDLQLADEPNIVPWGTEGYRKRFIGTAELLYRDQHILNESKTRRKKTSYGLDW